MFDEKVPAEAQVLADEGSGSVVERDTHGVPWDHRKYILEVRPVGQAAFRVEVKAKVPSLHAPQGDPRYDPHLRRANAKQQRAAQAQALLSGAPAAPSVVSELDDDEPVPEDY